MKRRNRNEQGVCGASGSEVMLEMPHALHGQKNSSSSLTRSSGSRRPDSWNFFLAGIVPAPHFNELTRAKRVVKLIVIFDVGT
jgi:hypothetical protein